MKLSVYKILCDLSAIITKAQNASKVSLEFSIVRRKSIEIRVFQKIGGSAITTN